MKSILKELLKAIPGAIFESIPGWSLWILIFICCPNILVFMNKGPWHSILTVTVFFIVFKAFVEREKA